MIFRQFLQSEPFVAASYLFGCGGKGVGAVCDPIDDPSLYQRAAEQAGLKIVYVFDTHVHADHVSGGRQLARLTGSQYALHAQAGAQYDHLPVHEGDILKMGNVEVRVLHTPGHTPEHVSLLVMDKTRGQEPWFVLTGHTLMVGDMGRTELASSAEEGARALFESTQKMKALPDYVEVLPGAFAGSVCGRALSGKPTSTIGFERRYNWAFQLTDCEAFVNFMLQEIPPRPPNAEQIRAVNLGLRQAVI
jgi:hydroxyacylglutathione hydrolase